MKKLCPDCAPGYTCCDHCAFYEFRGDTQGCYTGDGTGDGWCRLHKEKRDPGSDCQDLFFLYAGDTNHRRCSNLRHHR